MSFYFLISTSEPLPLNLSFRMSTSLPLHPTIEIVGKEVEDGTANKKWALIPHTSLSHYDVTIYVAHATVAFADVVRSPFKIALT